MNKNKLLIVIVVVLVAIAAWLFFDQKSGTINEALRDFGVKDTASVTRIFMANKSGQQILLDKQPDGSWMINKKHWARPDAVQTLLKTMYDVEVRSPVARAAYNTIIKSIASKGVKVEIYNKNGLFKTYYVGGPTPDQLGTFMYIENSSSPFITHIPGFDGYLTPRYITDEKEWIVKNVFRLPDGQLKRLVVTDREKPGYAFSFERDEKADYVIYDVNETIVENVSQDKVINYLMNYRMLNYEGDEKSLEPRQKDSLMATTPFRSIVLTDMDNKTTRVDLWRRPITNRTTNKTMEDGTPFPYDIDRMTAAVNGDTTLYVVQYFSWENYSVTPLNSRL